MHLLCNGAGLLHVFHWRLRPAAAAATYVDYGCFTVPLSLILLLLPSFVAQVPVQLLAARPMKALKWLVACLLMVSVCFDVCITAYSCCSCLSTE